MFLLHKQGCSSPLVVKFADTQKEKDQKRIHQAATNLWGLGSLGGINGLTPPYLVLESFKSVGHHVDVWCCEKKTMKGLPTNGTSGLQQLSGLNALGVQQLLAASTPTSLASTQGKLESARRSFRRESFQQRSLSTAALQSLANLQSQAGLGLNGGSSPGSAVNELGPASGLGLAALANFNSPGLFSSLGKRSSPFDRVSPLFSSSPLSLSRQT